VAPVSDLTPASYLPNRGRHVAVLFSAFTGLALAIVSPFALLSTLLDAAAAFVVIAPACMLGLTLVPLFRLGDLPGRWHFLLGAAFGIGLLALLVLALGLIGVLNRGIWIVILGASSAAGAVRIRGLRLRQSGGRQGNGEVHQPAWRYAWLILVPFFVLALLAASHAPGLLWAEEGYGYDVLEYHLQVPKTYYQQGRIAYAQGNVYANFPSNVEMLYLLAMILHRDTYAIGTTTHLIHCLLGLLAVYAAWAMGREWSAAAGVATAIAMGTIGWLVYLSGLAYVENGLLFFGMVSLASVIRGASAPGVAVQRRWLIVAGLLAGLACGCKYTGVVMVAMPIALGLLVLLRTARRRIGALAVYCVGTAIGFSPWLAKNAAMTGSPVFPLANSVFQAYPPGWGLEEQERWDRGHSVSDEDRPLFARWRALWRHTLADHDQRIGPALLVIAIAGFLRRRWERVDALLLMVLAIQLCVWLCWTHLYARFVIPMLAPLSALVGRSTGDASSPKRSAVVLGVLAVGAAWNATFATRVYMREGIGGSPASLLYDGKAPGYEYLGAVNRDLPAEARVLLIGDARPFYIQRPVDFTVVFNTNPFVQMVEAAQTTEQIMEWLRESGYSHVVVHWMEIERLRRTYGFSQRITPELFSELSRAGLLLWRAFPHPATGGRYVDIYQVMPPGSQPVSNGP
jgi:hypothetical protein